MATRRLSTKERRPEVSPSIWNWLNDQNPERVDENGNLSFEIFLLEGEWLHHWGDEDDRLGKLWRELEADVLEDWIAEHPGARPRLWWQYSAPRQPVGTFEGCFYDGKFQTPREKLTGAGCPAYETLAYLPAYTCGIPDTWDGFDGEDPPVFESQAAYLLRHGLLTPAEIETLTREDYELPELVDFGG